MGNPSRAANVANWTRRLVNVRYEHGFSPLAPKYRKGCIELANRAGVDGSDFEPERVRDFTHGHKRGLAEVSVTRVDQHGDTNCLGHQLVQER